MSNLGYRLVQSIGLIIVSLSLLFGGIAILYVQIPFWSLVYGLPAVFLGIMLTILSFNEIARNRTTLVSEYHEIPCRICGKSTLVPFLIEKTVCSNCQYKMAQRLQIGILILIAFLAIPITFYLSRQTQSLRQNAKQPESSPLCQGGRWQPNVCRCGTWVKGNGSCNEGETPRLCSRRGETYCCKEINGTFLCHVSFFPHLPYHIT